MDFKPVFEQPFDPSGLLTKFLTITDQEKDILKLLQHNGITHVLMRDDLTASWFSQLNDADKKIILPFFQTASNPLFRKNEHTFFLLNSEN